MNSSAGNTDTLTADDISAAQFLDSVGGSGSVSFPARNESLEFRVALEAKYRDDLRRGAGQSAVDNEGDVVWIQEYLRYRVNSCGHAVAIDKVFAQIDGRGVQPVCG